MILGLLAPWNRLVETLYWWILFWTGVDVIMYSLLLTSCCLSSVDGIRVLCCGICSRFMVTRDWSTCTC